MENTGIRTEVRLRSWSGLTKHRSSDIILSCTIKKTPYELFPEMMPAAALP